MMTTLGEVSDKVAFMSMNCFDEVVNTGDIRFDDLDTMRIGSELHSLRPMAQHAIAYRLGIPLQYLKRCPSELQAQNLNHWIEQEKDGDLFIRFDGDDVRAMFSQRYRPIDNFEVIERLSGMGYTPETKVQCQMDDAFMSLSIPDGRQTFKINGDAMTPGISISNSEVGLSSLSISAYILRLVCTNGLIATDSASKRYRHVSRDVLERFPEVLGGVSYELTQQKAKLRISMDSPVAEPMATLERLNRQFNLGKLEQEAVVDWAWPLESGPAMFHIIQTYTRAAQYGKLTAEVSNRLQRIGGMVLGMVE